MIYKILPIAAFFLISLSSNQNASSAIKTSALTESADLDTKAELAYSALQTGNYDMPQLESFKTASRGFYQLKQKGLVKRDVLTLVDFTISSNKKRMWVIDMATNTVLYQSLVAHGRNTGEEFANKFSNREQSFQSSLGFYTTGEIYTGKHGLSLKLDGLEKGVNDNARNRAVVVHGADYVSDSFIRNHTRLGRSQGCPAVPNELAKPIISTIKGGSLMYIHHSSHKTALLNS
jgi:hypothetical protein